MGDVIHVRGEGGARFTLDLPLHEAIADQLAKGTLVRTNEDGSEPFTGEDVLAEAPAPAESPAPEEVVAPAPPEPPEAPEPVIDGNGAEMPPEPVEPV